MRIISNDGELQLSIGNDRVENNMRLSAFIRENSQAIISEWESFARSLVPAADGMTPLSLRNHISFILDFIAHDIDTV